jgi:predicted ATPase
VAYRKQLTRLKAPYLKRVLLDPERVEDWEKYPWNLPLFRGREFELEFATPITHFRDNGTGKWTLPGAMVRWA